MYIEPNSTIKIIYQCPLDASYENTLWFDTVADQINYFQNTLGGYTFAKQSYQRVTKNSFRIAKPAEEMYDCNYLAFRNISFGSKWFYAFIDKIEYVNNVTSEITYTIDVMQTWHFDYSMEQCFVEREHSVTDEIGDNIVDEGLATGEYVSDGMTFPNVGGSSTPYCIQIWATIDRNYDRIAGVVFDNAYQWYYSGLYCIEFPMTQQGVVNAANWLWDLRLHPLVADAIVSINVAPYWSGTDRAVVHSIQKQSGIARDDGTPIKNNKLYTYPYNFLYVTNNQGGTAVYRYEFFTGDQYCDFEMYCGESPNPCLLLIPKNYKGAIENFDEKLELSGFPQIAYNVDSFKAWLAQSASSLALQGVIDAGVGFAIMEGTAAPAVVAAAGLATVSKIISGVVASAKPPQSKGTQGTMTLLAMDKLRFGFMHKYITPNYVSIIDDYFNLYGYACRQVKYPNRSSRPEWNYVKTIGCKIRSGIPSDDATAIEKLYDVGIRFWKNPAHVGNYTFDNSPVQNNPNIPNG